MADGLTLEVENLLSGRLGEAGIDADAFERAAPERAALAERLNGARSAMRWRDLPHDPLRRAHVDAIRPLVERLRPDTRNLIVLGIGGSALGNIALHAALNPLTYNLMPQEQRGGPRLFVLDNVDPRLVADTIDEVRRDDPQLRHTIVNVISKSGETAETAAQFILFRSMLKAVVGDGYAQRIIAITDPRSGTMRGICDAEGYATLPVPEGVGGRFSVLSPVGLFSAAMCGIDIDALLDGAAAMDERCAVADEAADNPAVTLAWLLHEHTKRGRPNHVLMPYANALYSLADWYRQLWAESLGKQYDRDGRVVYAGATPIKALGATDQHSQVQLYREGPDDKVIGFVEVEDFGEAVMIPSDLDVEPLKYLQGRSLHELLNAEKRATEYALLESARPNYTLRLPRIDARAVGGFLQLWMVATAAMGELLNINAFDQPAVETGKLATFGLMGRAGYESWREKVDAALERSATTAKA